MNLLPVGIDNPLTYMAGTALGNFAHKFLNTAKTHQINEINKDIAVSKQSAKFANSVKSEISQNVPSISNVIGSAAGSISAEKPSYSSGTSAASVSEAPVSPVTVDYLNAELAKHYGMGRSTAYQEALSNTSYQRAVKDMKAAGLNPAAIFGAGKGYTAGGVSYIDNGDTGSTSYGSGAGSGAGKNNKNGKLFSEGAYHSIATAVGLAGMAAMGKGPIGYYISETAAKSVMGALNEIFN